MSNVIAFPTKVSPSGDNRKPVEKTGLRARLVVSFAKALCGVTVDTLDLIKQERGSIRDLSTYAGEAVAILVHGSVLSLEEKKPGEIDPAVLEKAFGDAFQSVMEGYRSRANEITFPKVSEK